MKKERMKIMKKMKKIFAIMCVLTMVLAMTACGNTNNQEETSSADTAEGLTANDSADIEPWLNSLGYDE